MNTLSKKTMIWCAEMADKYDLSIEQIINIYIGYSYIQDINIRKEKTEYFLQRGKSI